jgi:hypothetical protein
MDDIDEPNIDMFATADEPVAEILALYARARAHADATIEGLSLDATGTVPWWPPERNPVPLRLLLVHMIAETNRHAGHADIVRELIDSSAGLRADNDNLPGVPADWWPQYLERLETIAREATG